MRLSICFAVGLYALAGVVLSPPAMAKAQRVIAVKPEAPLPVSTTPISKVLAPADAWVVDYADDACSLIRRFGPSDAPVLFRMRQFRPGDQAEYTVMGPKLDFDMDEAVDARFAPGSFLRPRGAAYEIRFPKGDGVLFEATWVTKSSASEDAAPDQSVSNAGEKATEAASEQFELRGVVKEPIALSTGPMDEPLAALRACIDDLYEGWGVDLAAIDNASRRARTTDIDRWARKMRFKYPMTALARGLAGNVPLTLIIDEKGRVERCVAQLPYKDDTLEEAACRSITLYGRFKPALNSDGEPIKDYTPFDITYALE